MNTLILEGGQGTNRITDTSVHNIEAAQIVVLEDSTEFGAVFISTLQADGTFGNPTLLAAGVAPGLGAGHQKGEYISLVSGEQIFSQITLVSGSIRYYNS